MKVTCVKEYKLSIITDKTKNKGIILHTFNVGDTFNKIYPANKNLIHREGFIRIDVGQLYINDSNNKNSTYEIVLVPESHFLTIEELRDYNINKILE